jgi:hypothetical protein
LNILGTVCCRRHADDNPLVLFLFSAQESADLSGNGWQEQKLSMGRSHRGSFFTGLLQLVKALTGIMW